MKIIEITPNVGVSGHHAILTYQSELRSTIGALIFTPIYRQIDITHRMIIALLRNEI